MIYISFSPMILQILIYEKEPKRIAIHWRKHSASSAIKCVLGETEQRANWNWKWLNWPKEATRTTAVWSFVFCLMEEKVTFFSHF